MNGDAGKNDQAIISNIVSILHSPSSAGITMGALII